MRLSSILAAAAALVALAGCGDDAARVHQKVTTALAPAQQLEVDRRRRAQRAHRSAPALATELLTLPEATARPRLLAALRRSVLRDARARHRRGEIDGRFIGVSCDVFRADRTYARRASRAPALRYECLAITSRANTDPPMTIGTPFLARVDFAARRYAWCLFTPIGGEGALPLGREVPPPLACSRR